MHGGNTVRTVPAPLRVISQALVFIAGIVLIFLIFLTVGDVLGRNLRGQSILGAVDISTLALVAVAFLGLAAAEIDGRHVSVDLVEMNLPKKIRTGLALVRTVLLGLIGVVLTWGMYGTVTSAFERSETTNGILRIATWPVKSVLLAAFLLFFIVAVWNSFNEFLDMREGKRFHNHESIIVHQALSDAEDLTNAPAYSQEEDKQ